MIFSQSTSCLPQSSQKFNINIAASPSYDLPTISPQLESSQLASRYSQTVTKKIVLDDGRVVKCHIPLLNPDHENLLPRHPRNLTKEEIEPIFVHLKDICTQHRTNDFLWEFCFEKYVRQYDDEITKKNAAKPKFELIFLGFHTPSQSLKYLAEIHPHPKKYSPEREYHQLPIRQEIPNYEYIQTIGRVVRVLHIPQNYNQRYIYSVFAYIPATEIGDDDVIDSSGMTKKNYKHTFRSRNLLSQGFYQVERTISKVLSPYVLLLNEPFPFDIVTNQAQITLNNGYDVSKPGAYPYTDVILSQNRYVGVSGTFLYGSIEFISDIKPFTTVLLETGFGEYVNRVVVEVIDDYVVRLDKPINQNESAETKIEHTVFLGSRPEVQSLVWEQKKGQVYAMGTIILGKETSFKTDFERGDQIMLAGEPDLFTNDRSLYLREVLEVMSDNVMKVRSTLLPPKHGEVGSTGVYLVGKYKDLKEYSNQFFNKSQKKYRKDSISHINTETPNSLLFRKYEEELKEDVLLCHSGFYFPNPKSWLLTFVPSLLDENDANLMIYLSSKSCSSQGVEINFHRMEKIILMAFDEKSTITASQVLTDLNKHVQKYNKKQIWILLHQGSLKIGIGNEISFENQLLSFQVPQGFEVAHYSFHRQFSYNVILQQIQVATLPKIALESSELMDKIPPVQGDARYFESFAKGSFCEKADKYREVDIEYKCAKSGEIFKIEEIREDAVCHYHMVIGTNLLCEKKKRAWNEETDFNYNINCII